MASNRIWWFFKGWIEVEVEGRAVEKFLNLAASQQITVWGVLQRKGLVVLQLPASSFNSLKPLVHATGCRVHVRRRLGLPFLIAKLRHRLSFSLGILIFFGIIWSLSSRIWFIDIEGANLVPKEAVIAELKGNGVRPGIFRSKLDPERLSKAIELKFSDVAWAGIEVTGTKMTVKVVEKLNPLPFIQQQGTGDIVARHDGIITKLIVMSGMAQAVEGEVVSRGQVLIEGAVPDLSQSSDAGSLAYRRVPARGIVVARSWFTAYAEQPVRVTEPIRTGKVFDRVLIILNDREIILKGKPSVPFDSYELEEKVYFLGSWRSLDFNVELVRQRFYEMSSLTRFISKTEAKQKAMEAAETIARVKAGPLLRVTKVDFKEVSGDDYVGISAVLEAEGDIGIFKPHEAGRDLKHSATISAVGRREEATS